MYIWIIVATFITVLYSFNLSYRADMRQLVMEPKAETVVAKLVIKHKAATRYIEDRTPPANGSTVITYVKGRMTAAMLESYIPYGFGSLDAGVEEFRTTIYCIDKNSVNGSATISCASGDAAKYVVSYGCIPERWRSLNTGLPNGDLVGAMNRRLELGPDFGYAKYWSASDGDDNKITTKMFVRGKGFVNTPIPDYIATSQDGVVDSFSSVCGDTRPTGSCAYCLAYISVYE